MVLEILLLIGTLEKAIGGTFVKVTFSSYAREDDTFPSGLKLRAEWLVERQLIRLEHIIPAHELAQAKNKTEMEAYLLEVFVQKARKGYQEKLHEIRTNIEREIRNAASRS